MASRKARDKTPGVAGDDLVGMRRTGSRSATKANQESVIDLLSDDEEEARANQLCVPSQQETNGDEINKLESAKRSVSIRLSDVTPASMEQRAEASPLKSRSDIVFTVCKDVLKIAVGKKIFDEGCRIEFAKGILTLKATKRNRELELSTWDLSDECLKLKYFLIDEKISQRHRRHPPFFSVSVEPIPADRLDESRSTFAEKSSDTKRNLCVVKFGSDSDLKEVLECMKRSLPDASRDTLKSSNARRVYGCLHDHDEKAEEILASDDFVAGRRADSVLLVYPFDGDCNQMEEAAAGLPEASGGLFAQSAPPASKFVDHCEQLIPVAAVGNTDLASRGQSEPRRHFLTIQIRDFKLLKPRQFLNDTLIDFWIQW
jgi:hypothetical protein